MTSGLVRRAEGSPLVRMVGYHDLVADLRKAGCPICHGAHRSAWRYLDGVLWESVNDPGVRTSLRASHGYCRDHARMLLRVADAQSGALGVSILVEDLLQHVSADAALEAAAKRPGSRRRRRRLLPQARCDACSIVRNTEEIYVRILAAAEEGSPPFVGIRAHGRGVCLPHVSFGVAMLGDVADRDRFVACFLHGTEELRGELTEFARKHDYRFRGEGMADGEATAWRRGMYRLVGEPSPSTPPSR